MTSYGKLIRKAKYNFYKLTVLKINSYSFVGRHTKHSLESIKQMCLFFQAHMDDSWCMQRQLGTVTEMITWAWKKDAADLQFQNRSANVSTHCKPPVSKYLRSPRIYFHEAHVFIKLRDGQPFYSWCQHFSKHIILG